MSQVQCSSLAKGHFSQSLECHFASRSRSVNEEQSKDRKECLNKASEECNGAGANIGVSGSKGSGSTEASTKNCIRDKYENCSESKSMDKTGDSNSAEDIRIISRGSKPYSFDDWASGDFKPLPVQMKVKPITVLVTDENLNKSVKYGFPQTLNASG